MPLSTASGSAPLYHQLAEILKRDIDGGVYQVGDLLPPEFELSEQYGMSRHTVREAIRKLVEGGLVVRRKGIGTEVRSRTSEPRYVASLSTLADLFQYTQSTRLKVFDEKWVTADAELAALLHCQPGQRWLKFETCRYPVDNSTPIAFTEIYVYPAYASIREKIDGNSVWIYGVIEEMYGEPIQEVTQETDPIAVPPGISDLLECETGTPALHTRRYYMGANDRLLSVSVNIYPRHRFTLRTSWRLARGGSNGGA